MSLAMLIVTTLIVFGAWLYPTSKPHDFTPVGLACATFPMSPLGSLCGLFEIAAMRNNKKKGLLALSWVGLIGNIVWFGIGLVFLLRFHWVRWLFGH
jgi:hypothetical protein